MAERTAALRELVNAIIAPATPFVSAPIGQNTVALHGREVPLRPNIDIYTQPISFIDLPVVPVPVPRLNRLPNAVQIIAAPWREDVAMRIAYDVATRGVVHAPRPPE